MKPFPNTFIQNIDLIINEHLAQQDLNHLLVKFLKLSASQVYRKVKQKTGVSPSVYIRRKRLQQAHIWIQKSEVSISEIAKIVGFRQLAYFSRCFSDFYGYSPITLRKR